MLFAQNKKNLLLLKEPVKNTAGAPMELPRQLHPRLFKVQGYFLVSLTLPSKELSRGPSPLHFKSPQQKERDWSTFTQQTSWQSEHLNPGLLDFSPTHHNNGLSFFAVWVATDKANIYPLHFCGNF